MLAGFIRIFGTALPILTSIEAAHKGNLVVHNAELLVVGPEEHEVVASAVQGLQRILRELRQAEGTL